MATRTKHTPSIAPPSPPPISSLRSAITSGYVEIVASPTSSGEARETTKQVLEGERASGARGTNHPSGDDVQTDKHRHLILEGISIPSTPCLHPGYDRLAAAGNLGTTVTEAGEGDDKHLSNLTDLSNVTDLELPVIIVTSSTTNLSVE